MKIKVNTAAKLEEEALRRQGHGESSLPMPSVPVELPRPWPVLSKSVQAFKATYLEPRGYSPEEYWPNYNYSPEVVEHLNDRWDLPIKEDSYYLRPLQASPDIVSKEALARWGKVDMWVGILAHLLQE